MRRILRWSRRGIRPSRLGAGGGCLRRGPRRRGPFPERFGDHEPEALADGFLDHDLGEALEGVDLDVADAGEIGEHVDAVVVAGCVLDLAGRCPSPGGRRGPSSRSSASCRSGISSRTSRYAAMTPSGSFQGSKRDTWVMRGRAGFDADPLEHTGSEDGAELQVLGALGVDRRWDDLDACRPGNPAGRNRRG